REPVRVRYGCRRGFLLRAGALRVSRRCPCRPDALPSPVSAAGHRANGRRRPLPSARSPRTDQRHARALSHDAFLVCRLIDLVNKSANASSTPLLAKRRLSPLTKGGPQGGRLSVGCDPTGWKLIQ